MSSKNDKLICCICGKNAAAYHANKLCNFGACSDPDCLLMRILELEEERKIRNGKRKSFAV